SLATARSRRDCHPVRREPHTPRLRPNRRGHTELMVTPLLVRERRDQGAFGTVPLRLAIRIGPHGPPRGNGAARALERLEPRALHNHKPGPYLGLAEVRITARRPAHICLIENGGGVAGWSVASRIACRSARYLPVA